MPARNKIEKRKWRIDSKEGKSVEFFPVFETIEAPEDESQVAGDTECRYIQIKYKDNKGEEVLHTFNYLDLYMFMYFVSSEELRVNLAQRYERKVNMIPYDVSFTLDNQEKQQGFAKRRIEVPIDEVSMAVARQKAFEMTNHVLSKGGTLNPKDFLYDKRKK